MEICKVVQVIPDSAKDRRILARALICALPASHLSALSKSARTKKKLEAAQGIHTPDIFRMNGDSQ